MTDHVPTKEEPGPFDGFETLKPGEPFFPLQGGDPLSEALVQLWADAARIRAGIGNPDCLTVAFSKLVSAATHDKAGPHKREELLLRATEAESISWAMAAYRKGEKVVERETESYSGHVESEESKDKAKRAQTMHDLAQQLEEAKYYANETAMALDQLDSDGNGFSVLADSLRQAVALTNSVAVAIRPSRRA